MISEIKLPEIASNITKAIVLDILVTVGQKIEKDSSLAEMESEKATFELPSDTSGVIKEIKIKSGDEVSVGQVMFIIDTEDSTEKEEKSKKEAAPGKEQTDKGTEKQAEETIESVEDKMEPGTDKEPAGEQDKKSAREPEKKPEGEPEKKPEEEKEERKPEEKEESGLVKEVPASPSVRRFAREIGIDITKVKGTGSYNRITLEDVKAFAKRTIEAGSSIHPAAGFVLPDFSIWGPVRREKLETVRKITARAVSESWQNIPHVFQFDKADITELENFRKKYSKEVEKKGAKLTFTAILLKLSAEALKKFPRFNASIDMKNEEIIYKDYINIGVAVDTERGLLVPVIRDADKKNITELSIELNELAEKARNKKLMPDALQGGNFTISNLGGIGGTNFTPIVYRPDVAILGVSRAQTEPVYTNGEFRPVLMLPLSLSYDHRVIDGADGARFIRWLCEALENPLLTMFG